MERKTSAPLIADGLHVPWGYAITWVIVSTFLVWGFFHLGGFAWGWDEGVLLMTGRQLQRGAPLYAKIWYNYPPLFPRMLATVFNVLGPSAAAGRGMVLVLSGLLLGGVSAIGYRLSRGWFPALSAVLLVVLAPPFLLSSRAVVADLPALSLAVWAVALATWNLERPHWGRFIGAGILYGLSLAIKPTAVFAGLPLAIAACWPDRDSARRVSASAVSRVSLLVLGALVALVVSMTGSHLGTLVRQVLGSLATSKGSHGLQVGANLVEILAYLAFVDHPGPRYVLPLLLVPGLVFLAVARRRPQSIVLLSWWSAGVLTWLTHVPLYSHHLITLLVPSALIAAYGVAGLVRWAPFRHRLPSWILATLALLLVAYLAGAGRLMTHGARFALPSDDDEDADALDLARALPELLAPERYLVTDSLMLAFVADRQVPPELVNTSSYRIETGQLNASQAIAWTQAYGVEGIVFWDDRLELLPEYVAWVQERFRLDRAYGNERRVYLSHSPSPETAHTTFGGELVLEGYSLSAPTAEWQYLELTLDWRALERPSIDPALQLEIVDDQGYTQMFWDAPLASGDLKPKRWRQNDRAVLVHRLATEQLEEGTYQVALSLQANGARLAATDMRGTPLAENRAMLPMPFMVSGP